MPAIDVLVRAFSTSLIPKKKIEISILIQQSQLKNASEKIITCFKTFEVKSGENVVVSFIKKTHS